MNSLSKGSATFTYDSIHDFLASEGIARDICARQPEKWNGNQSFDDAKRNCLAGVPENVRASDALLEKLEADGIDRTGLTWDLNRVGHIPCVPAYLAGSPLAMLDRCLEIETATAPIKVYASICASAGVSGDQLRARGVALLAFVRKLSIVRPVELFVFAELGAYDGKRYNGYSIPCVKVPTNPLDLTTASYMLSDPGMLRQLFFNWGENYGFDGGWAWSMGGDYRGIERKLRELWACEETDVVIPGGYLLDELVNKPVEWINREIKKYSCQAQEN